MAPNVLFRSSSKKGFINSSTRFLLAASDFNNISWEFNNCVISTGEVRQKQSTLPGGLCVLDIPKLRDVDEGTYVAVLKDEQGGTESIPFELHIVDKPKESVGCHLIRGLTSHVQLTAGASASLRTRFLATPPPQVTWLRDDELLCSKGEDDFEVLLDGDTAELQLKRTSRNCMVTVIVENEWAVDYKQVVIKVKGLSDDVEVEDLEKFSEQFVVEDQLGSGRFGTVYRCVDKVTDGEAAAKIIKCLTAKDRQNVLREVEVMNKLRNHHKLLTLLAAYRGPKEIILVTEYIPGGELFERIVAEDFCLTESDCILYVRQICDAVGFMHLNGVLHLDLKPENILCTDVTGHNIKVIDFGLAHNYDPAGDLKVFFGTPEFVAPEVLNFETVTPKSDMWSIGVVAYVLLSGLSPFMGEDDSQTFGHVLRVDYEFDEDAFEDISETAKEFIECLLLRNPLKRPGCDEVIQHPWLNQPTPGDIPISKQRHKKFLIRRRWLRGANVICALNRLGLLSSRSNSLELTQAQEPPRQHDTTR